MKKNKFNYKMLIIPLFIFVTANLIVSIALSANQYNKTKNSGSIVNHVVSQSTNVLADNKQENINSMSLFLKAYDNLLNTKNVTIKSAGTINTFVTQKINLTKIYDGKTHYSQNITTGLKNVATRIYYTPDSTVTTVKGNDISANNAKWNGKVTNYSYSEFVNKFHLPPSTFVPYEISTLTISSVSPATKINDGYSLEISLHPTLATKNYAKNLQTIASLSNEPTFSDVSLKVTIDQNGNFKTIEVNESYNIKIIGITKKCTSNIVTSFDFISKATIPTVN